MLTNSNNNGLTHRGVNPKYMFFYQRWQEILDSRTLDMYQYNILNSCTACSECLDVINKTLNGLLIARQNVDDIKAETLYILKQDDILEKRNRHLLNSLKRIVSSKIESKSSTDDRNYFTSLNRLKYQLTSPIRILKQNYLAYILSELELDVEHRDNSLIEKHLMFLISQCIYNGWSAKGLFQLSMLFEGTASEDEKWNAFIGKISTAPQTTYLVFYSIKLETRQGISANDVLRTVRDLTLDVKKGNAIITENAQSERLCSKLDANKYYICLSIIAYDMYSAALSAINSLNKKISVATFFNTINPWILNSTPIVVYDGCMDFSESFKVTDIFKTYDYVDSTNNVFEDTKRVIQDPNKSAIMAKLLSAFSYTNLSRSSTFQETKYISLWIALESVMRTGQYTDVISHIKCVLPETLCLRYFYRMIRNFSEDCIRCGFRNDQELMLNMEQLDKKALVKQLISTFRNEEGYSKLKDRCQVNILLQYRCSEIYMFLNDIDQIKSKISHYRTKIEWHLQRLYRIRNEITHSAFQDNRSLTIYIEHLYTYLAQLICEIVFYIEHRDVDSVDEAYAVMRENYYTFMDLLDQDNLQISDIVPDGILNILL